MMSEFQEQAIVKSEDPADRIGKIKTIYEARTEEIIWRNFLAGASRTVGGLFVYAFFLIFGAIILSKIFIPQIKPLIDSFTGINESLKNIPNFNSFR